jgi:predicted AAA+ superfamily ATPase
MQYIHTFFNKSDNTELKPQFTKVLTNAETYDKIIKRSHKLNTDFTIINDEVFDKLYNYLIDKNYTTADKFFDYLRHNGDETKDNGNIISKKPTPFSYHREPLVLYCRLYQEGSFGLQSVYARYIIYGNQQVVKKMIHELMLNSNTNVYEFDENRQAWTLQTCKINYCEISGTQCTAAINLIGADLANIKKNREEYTFLGKTQGLNYLLVGPPGNGKTTTIKTIVREHGGKLCKCNLGIITKPSSLKTAMSTVKISDKQIVFVVFEDFDRYIDKLRSEQSDFDYSVFLNSLDGIESQENVVRIFTANDPSKITDRALLSRFKRIINFSDPNTSVVTEHLTKYYTKFTKYNVTTQEIERFASIVVNKYHFNMRTINNYISRFIDVENPMRQALQLLPEYAEELKLCVPEDTTGVYN